MVGRIYTISFEAVALSAVQDMFQVKGAAGKILLIRGVKFGCTTNTLPTAQNLALRMRFLPVTVTDGNGSSVTPRPVDQGSPAATFTALKNSTTQATSSGTAVVIRVWGIYLFAGLDYQFPTDQCIVVGPSQSATFELQTAPSGTVNISAEVTVEEIG